jgi:putative transposase
MGYKLLNKECITKKDNNIVTDGEIHNHTKFIYDWELKTPKYIRNGALRDIRKAYKTAWANIKAGNIRSFGLEFRKKKRYMEQSMEVPASAIKIIKRKNKIIGFKLYSRYMKSYIKIDKRSLKNFNLTELTHDTRLKKENNEWFLCIARYIKGTNIKMKEKICALDPGIRKFQVIYSEDKITSIEPDKTKVRRIYSILDKFQELRDKKLITQKTYDKKRCRIQAKLTNLVDDMHYKTIAYLTNNYTSILLPSFETQDMVKSRKLHKTVKRDMLNYSFFKFKQRLQHKCSITKYCNVSIVNEAYTSQTCGYCGNLKKTSDEIIKCDKCNKVFDRDINGSRNIYIKYTKAV